MSFAERSQTGLESSSYVGVDIGALTVKVVLLRQGAVRSWMVPHQGRPIEVLDDMLASHPEIGPVRFVGVVGHLGHISEVAALQRALQELGQDFDAVVSLGGESLLVYILSRAPSDLGPLPQQVRGRQRRVPGPADRAHGARARRGDRALPFREGHPPRLALLGPLQVGHHPQAEPAGSQHRGHPVHPARRPWPTR